MNHEYWEFLCDTMSFELDLLKTIGYFAICLSKKVVIFTEIILKTKNQGYGKKFSLL